MADYGQVDTSIPLSIGKGQPTMMEGLGKFAATLNSINENRLFIGRQAAGDALQKSINPETGEVDWQRANKLIHENPRIAPYAQEALGQMLEQQGQDVLNTTKKVELTRFYIDKIRQDIGATKTPEAALGAILRGVATGSYPKSVAIDFVGGTDLGALIKEAAIASGEESLMEAQFGKPETIEIGGKSKGVITNRVDGTRTEMGGDAAEIDKTLTPEAKAARVPIIGPDGQPQSVPQSALVTETGQPRVSGLTGPHGEIDTALAPGEAESRAIVAEGAAGQAQEFAQIAEGTVQRSALLHELLATQGEFRSGPGAARWSGIVGEFNRAFNANLAADDVAAQQTFTKIAENVAALQRSAMGSAATNAQTEAAKLASPNTVYSPEANHRVTALLLGNEDYISAKNRAWQSWIENGGKPSQYNRFVTQFNELYDPRYFQERYMTPKQKEAMFKAMSDAEIKKYNEGKKRALSLSFAK